MDCKTARQFLEFTRPPVPELEPGDADALETHLADCPDCGPLARAERGFDYRLGQAMRSVPLPGSQEAIASLHRAGFRMAVATNDSTSGAEKTLLALGIAQMFDAAYGYDAVANP